MEEEESEGRGGEEEEEEVIPETQLPPEEEGGRENGEGSGGLDLHLSQEDGNSPSPETFNYQSLLDEAEESGPEGHDPPSPSQKSDPVDQNKLTTVPSKHG